MNFVHIFTVLACTLLVGCQLGQMSEREYWLARERNSILLHICESPDKWLPTFYKNHLRTWREEIESRGTDVAQLDKDLHRYVLEIQNSALDTTNQYDAVYVDWYDSPARIIGISRTDPEIVHDEVYQLWLRELRLKAILDIDSGEIWNPPCSPCEYFHILESNP